MIPFKSVCGGLLCLFLLLDSLFSQDLLDYANTLRYADYLYRTHQFKPAAVELERAVFLEPGDTLAKLKLVRSYRYLKEYGTANARIKSYFCDGPDYLPGAFSDEYIKNLLYENRFQEAGEFLRTNRTMGETGKAEYGLGIHVMQCRWEEARQLADHYSGFHYRSDKLEELNDIIDEGLNTRYRSPALAASLSAVVPGSGKLYTGQWKDAIFSFLFVTTGSWLTYRSYMNKGVNINTVFIGTVTLGFYSANIYGSSKSAKKYNQKINQSFFNDVEAILLNDRGPVGSR
ncbi:MAG: hypothetical protein JXA39_05245, partial [Bacteroidales bacterium]|nr:hypothetical protein [Bacteroidales bacterium]